MSYPLQPSGHRQERRGPALRKMRETTSQRAGHRCEWQAGCGEWGVDPAHGWGRGNVICTTLADHPALAWRACRWHHRLADGHRQPVDDEEAAQLEGQRWWLVRLAEAGFGAVERETNDRPVDVIRRLERRLDAEGVLAEWRIQRREAMRR